jgi:transcriptional regulator with XRE-family HTH domain
MALGLTRRELCDRAAVPYDSLRSYELGRRDAAMASHAVLVRIAEALGWKSVDEMTKAGSFVSK